MITTSLLLVSVLPKMLLAVTVCRRVKLFTLPSPFCFGPAAKRRESKYTRLYIKARAVFAMITLANCRKTIISQKNTNMHEPIVVNPALRTDVPVTVSAFLIRSKGKGALTQCSC